MKQYHTHGNVTIGIDYIPLLNHTFIEACIYHSEGDYYETISNDDERARAAFRSLHNKKQERIIYGRLP